MCNFGVVKALLRYAALSALLLLVTCSEPTSRREEASTTPTPAEFVNGGQCPETDFARLKDRAGCVTIAHNDDAALFVYAIVGNDSIPARWRIRYESERSGSTSPLMPATHSVTRAPSLRSTSMTMAPMSG